MEEKEYVNKVITLIQKKVLDNLRHFENDLHCRFYRDADIDDRKEFIKEWISKNIEL